MLVSEIGKQIKERRDVLGITQPDLAEMAGVNVNTIYNIESGRGNPTLKKLNNIVDILGMALTLAIKNGDPAYMAKRFDVEKYGTKIGKEDFAALAGKTAETAGLNFKYEYSYEEMAGLIQKYIPVATEHTSALIAVRAKSVPLREYWH